MLSQTEGHCSMNASNVKAWIMHTVFHLQITSTSPFALPTMWFSFWLCNRYSESMLAFWETNTQHWRSESNPAVLQVHCWTVRCFGCFFPGVLSQMNWTFQQHRQAPLFCHLVPQRHPRTNNPGTNQSNQEAKIYLREEHIVHCRCLPHH